jgi:hypothetical protein
VEIKKHWHQTHFLQAVLLKKTFHFFPQVLILPGIILMQVDIERHELKRKLRETREQRKTSLKTGRQKQTKWGLKELQELEEQWKKCLQKKRERRLRETQEQRERHLQKNRERKVRRKSEETKEQRELRLKKEREKCADRRLQETQEQRETRLQKNRERKSQESEEQRQKRLQKERERRQRKKAEKEKKGSPNIASITT